MQIAPHSAKYFAHDLPRRGSTGLNHLSKPLFDAALDPNPLQIEAAIFALQSPLPEYHHPVNNDHVHEHADFERVLR